MSTNPKYVFLDFPHFESEDEEAEWWETHEDEVDDMFRRAYKAGALRRGAPARQANGADVTVQVPLDAEALRKAKAIARRRRLPYEAYLRLLIHKGLSREKVG